MCASCDTIFSWSLGAVPGQAGTCKLVYVLAWGYAYAGLVPCQGESTNTLSADWLTTTEWHRLVKLGLFRQS